MTEWLTFLFYWIGIMALIGGALALVQKFKPKEEESPTENDKKEKNTAD